MSGKMPAHEVCRCFVMTLTAVCPGKLEFSAWLSACDTWKLPACDVSTDILPVRGAMRPLSMVELGYQPDCTGPAALPETNGPMAFRTGLSFVLGLSRGLSSVDFNTCP